MAKLTRSERSKISKRIWKGRKPQHTCTFCHKGIWVGGIKEGGKWYHRSCLKRTKVVAMRRKYATRGFYAK